MDIEELNRQMSFFQNDYKQNSNTLQYQDNQAVNFPQPLDVQPQSIQIQRPSKTTGTNRNEINEKMSQMKMNQPMMTAPNPFNNIMPQHNQVTRNNSRYQESLDNHNLSNAESVANMQDSNYQNAKNNPLSAYFQQNYSTLNGHQSNPLFAKVQIEMPTSGNGTNTNTSARYNTHDSGLSFVNPNNLPVFSPAPNQSQSQNQQPGNGYHQIENKRIDYRQNMNSKVGNFIFDNPNAVRYNPEQVAYNPNGCNGYARDTRMVIQDSSKDMYRQEANSRMSQYSPLARASNLPINIANMSVNDFYSSMGSGNAVGQYQTAEEDARAVLNSRMGAYVPLAKVTPLEKPKTWQANNVNKAQPLVTHDELPVISH